MFGGYVQNIPAFKHMVTDVESGCTLVLGLRSLSGTALGITPTISRIQEKEENTFITMASKFKITSLHKHTVNTKEDDSALGYYRLSR
jgi:hypothetical protein